MFVRCTFLKKMFQTRPGGSLNSKLLDMKNTKK